MRKHTKREETNGKKDAKRITYTLVAKSVEIELVLSHFRVVQRQHELLLQKKQILFQRKAGTRTKNNIKDDVAKQVAPKENHVFSKDRTKKKRKESCVFRTNYLFFSRKT